MAASQRPDLSAAPPSGAASSKPWPVLARLPSTSGAAPAPQTTPTFDPPPPAPSLDAEEDWRPPVSGPSAHVGANATSQIDTPARSGGVVRHRVDGPIETVAHATRKLADDCATLEDFFAADLLARGQTPRADYLSEGDIASGRHGDRLTSQNADPRRPSRLTTQLSAKAFNLQNAVRPYAGLIVTAALVACAGLLYWLMLGPANAGALGSDRGDALQLEWSRIDAEAPTPAAEPAASGSGVSFDELAGRMRVEKPSRDAEPATPRGWPAASATGPRMAAAANPHGAALVTPLPAVDLPAAEPTYPTTGHAPLDFSQLSSSPAPSADEAIRAQVEVARRPGEVSAAEAHGAR